MNFKMSSCLCLNGGKADPIEIILLKAFQYYQYQETNRCATRGQQIHPQAVFKISL
jgi:hypothetical protein